MSCSQSRCESTGSTDRPIVFTPRWSHSGRRRSTSPSSVVQTGVKSFGWLKKSPQDDPSHSWKRMGPFVLSCSKSGAIWPSGMVMLHLLLADYCSRHRGQLQQGCFGRGKKDLPSPTRNPHQTRGDVGVVKG